ncbi:MAG: TPM domain-containing protein [Planctomycetaceae bacterium]|nr:TPM domain-containing protein [Planctomycetaceae bacterium]
MMYRMIPIGLALAALQGLVPCPAQTPPAGVRDHAGLFSPEAAREADEALQALRREGRGQVAIETVDSLDGASIQRRAVERARELKVHGLYILIAKKEHELWVEPSDSARSVFTRSRVDAITGTLERAFKANNFDGGLLAVVEEIRKDTGVEAAGPTVGVRDHARLFSAEAARKADEALQALRRDHQWQVAIETVGSLDGASIQRRAVERARELKVHELYILIAKKEHKLWVGPSDSARSVFTKPRVDAIVETLEKAFKAGDFDGGLLAAIDEIRKDTGASPEKTSTASTVSTVRDAAAPKGDVATAPLTPTPGDTSSTKTGALKSAPPSPVIPPQRVGGGVVPDKKGHIMTTLLIVVLGMLLLFWILSRSSRRTREEPYRGAETGPQAPPPGYAPGPPPQARPSDAFGGQPAYGPGPRPGAPVGGPAGYGPGPGYPAGGPPAGYGPPPPPQQGGGFISSALGGLGGAVVGNILYDQFGRPHTPEGHPLPPHAAVPGGVLPPDDRVEPLPPPPSETYDPNAGAGGDWGGDPNAGAGGDWGEGGSAAAADSAGGEGDWGSDAPESFDEPAGSDGLGGDGAGGDWGGGDDDQGGSW